MIGRLAFVPGTRGAGRVEEVCGLPLLRVEADPSGRLGNWRLDRAGRSLRRGGAVRTLLPRDFDRWGLLKKFGLRAIDPAPFLRAQAPNLALAGLRRREIDPERATIALNGARVDGEMRRTALELCPHVRRLVIDAPGWEGLAHHLRGEFGIPILPPGEEAQMALCFHPGEMPEQIPHLELYGMRPWLDGGELSWPALGGADGGDLALLQALWERGRLAVSELKFT